MSDHASGAGRRIGAPDEPRALALADDMAALPALALRYVEEAVIGSMNLPLDQRAAARRQVVPTAFRHARQDRRHPRPA